jgi:hypothetical protein
MNNHSLLFSYDEDSREGKDYENKNSQDQPLSQATNDSKFLLLILTIC